MRVVAAPGYEKRVTRLLSAAGRARFEASIVARPDAWPVIRATGGARKARVALPGRGKSGGARVIYYFAARPGLVVFLDIYAKTDKEDITDAEKHAIRNAIAQLEAAAQARDAGQPN